MVLVELKTVQGDLGDLGDDLNWLDQLLEFAPFRGVECSRLDTAYEQLKHNNPHLSVYLDKCYWRQKEGCLKRQSRH